MDALSCADAESGCSALSTAILLNSVEIDCLLFWITLTRAYGSSSPRAIWLAGAAAAGAGACSGDVHDDAAACAPKRAYTDLDNHFRDITVEGRPK